MIRWPDFADLPQPLAVAAHDAGAANLLIAWLEATGFFPAAACMEGPAAKLWRAAFPDRPTVSLDAAIAGAGTIVSGTGWASTLEHEARLGAARLGACSIAVVDHWVNYRMRFEREGIRQFPDCVWVADGYAADRARTDLPECSVYEFDNAYLAAQVADLDLWRGDLGADDPKQVCYALEPVKLPWGGGDSRPGEFQALEFFLANMDKAGIPAGTRVSLRAHPSDPPGKYDDFVARRADCNLTISPEEPLGRWMAKAGWIAGVESYVLVIGVAAGLPTITSLPPWGNELRIPHPELIQLRHL